LLPGEVVPAVPADSSSARRPAPTFHWHKPGIAKLPEGLPVWTIGLDLMSSANRRRGTLMVHRIYSTRDLQVDINLLTTAFPTALADALDRTLAHSAQVIAIPEQDTSMIAAQAG